MSSAAVRQVWGIKEHTGPSVCTCAEFQPRLLVFQEPLVTFCSWGIWVKLNDDFAAPFLTPCNSRPWDVEGAAVRRAQ